MLKSNFLSPHQSKRIAIITIALIGLALTFIMQRFDYSQLINGFETERGQFIFNRTLRFLINDNLMLLLIYGIFYNKKYLQFGLAVELFGFCFLLIPYFVLRYYTAIDHMYISFLHRLIVNPTLMLLLVPALYLQEKAKQK